MRAAVTSLPYWSLRDYEADGQVGRDDALGDHLESIAMTFDKVRRGLTATARCGSTWATATRPATADTGLRIARTGPGQCGFARLSARVSLDRSVAKVTVTAQLAACKIHAEWELQP